MILKMEQWNTDYCQPHLIPSVWCPKGLCWTSAGPASSWCPVGCPGYWSSLICSPNKDLYCAWINHIEDKAPGSCTEEPMAARATQTVAFSWQLHLVLLLIAESWLEWCEERLAVWIERVYELRDKERKRGMKQGSRSSLVIRNWTAPSCLCSAQGWMSRQIQRRTFYQPFLVCVYFCLL